MELLCWISIGGLAFIYAGYGIILKLLNAFGSRENKTTESQSTLPGIAVLIAAYNEEDIIKEKIENTLAIDYPKNKLKIYVVADGSNDSTVELASSFKDVKVLYRPARKGKSAAINRAMGFISEPITVFTDANVMINASALRALVTHYDNPKTGGVSGEKVVRRDKRAASAATEGAYWRYESFLKNQDAKLSTIVGAAGEMFSIRTELFEDIPENTLLDDFIISMNIVRKGFSVKYEPGAHASENPSLNIQEEYKRKVRIAAGGLQATLFNLDFCNPFAHGIISLQFLIHRVSRWTIAPILIITAFCSNLFLLHEGGVYQILFLTQVLFHAAALAGYFLNARQVKIKLLQIPFYFDFMHYCVIAGWCRFLNGSQSASWQKATRLSYN
jgi:cellulose synthase/poly-beta-1,6-N-acetylglucosamine synthase-like glycosyltransferase